MMTSEDSMRFEQWLSEIDALARKAGWKGSKRGGESYTKDTGSDYWLPYFLKGDAPQEAWEIEYSYWD